MLSITLIERNRNMINAAVPNAQNVASDSVGLQSFSMKVVGSSGAYASTDPTVGVEVSRWTAFGDTATPPGIAQGRRLLNPGTTIRVPDYDKMRHMCPDEWLKELRTPGLVLAIPESFMMPLPTYPKKVNRANISAIVDQNWEYHEGGVQLRGTSCPCRSRTAWRRYNRTPQVPQRYPIGPSNTCLIMDSPPPPPSPRHFRWQTATSPIHDASSIESSPVAVTPVMATMQFGVGPVCHCNWADCPYCPMPVPNEVCEGAGASNWQAAFAIRSTNQGSLHKATSPRVRTHGRHKNPRTTQAKPAKKVTGGACKGTSQRAVTKQPMKGVRADAEEEYWQVATLLGLVRRV